MERRLRRWADRWVSRSRGSLDRISSSGRTTETYHRARKSVKRAGLSEGWRTTAGGCGLAAGVACLPSRSVLDGPEADRRAPDVERQPARRRRARLSGRPGEHASAEEMQVDVEHRLP